MSHDRYVHYGVVGFIIHNALPTMQYLLHNELDKNSNSYNEIATLSVLLFCIVLDDRTCDRVCDHHCVRQRNAQPRCVCDRGYYLAQDGITCIGNVCMTKGLR